MFYRLLAATACVAALAGCQQAGPRLHSTGSITAPSASLALKPVEVPFTGVLAGEAVFDFMQNPKGCPSGFTTVTTATGTASHMGRTVWQSQHCADETHQLLNAELVLVAANGDELHATYTGACGAIGEVGEPFACSGTAVLAGGTGRFADAEGTVEWKATVVNEGFADPSWPGTWEWRGAIRY